MPRTWAGALGGVAMALACGGSIRAAELCGWMLEKTDAESNYHEVEIWLEADQDMAFFYRIAGDGLSDESSRGHSPNSGTFVLHPGKAERPWGFGFTLQPPGQIDVVTEIRETPKDIFSDEATPLLAAFTFRRAVPADETAPPPDLARRQCATVAAR